MQFHDFRITRDYVGKDVPSDEFYSEHFSFALGGLNDKATAFQMVSERLREKDRRPYYNVYPAIAPMLRNNPYSNGSGVGGTGTCNRSLSAQPSFARVSKSTMA